MLQPESYIVRIYRRESPRQVKGVVEIVRTGRRVGFATSEDLWAVIVSGLHLRARKRAHVKRS
jgi:hypothetical protein